MVSNGIAFGRLDKKDLQTIYISLPETPIEGGVIGRDMAYEGGYFQIKQSPSSEATTSWNTSFAYAIHIESWQIGPSTITSCGLPEVGRASGKVYVSYEGSELSFKNFWVVGEFKDAAIIYCGKSN